MIGHIQRTGAFAVLTVGLASCSSGSPAPPRTAVTANQSGTMNSTGMNHSGVGQMDHAQMVQHCRAMMQGEEAGIGGATANSGGLGQIDHTQLMQHCRAMMQGEGGTQPTR